MSANYRNAASRLNERVSIERPVKVLDELGGQQVEWSELASVWAEVIALTGSARERVAAKQTDALAGYRVRIRWRNDVNATMRLRWRSHLLSIHSLHEHHDLLDILTYEEGL